MKNTQLPGGERRLTLELSHENKKTRLAFVIGFIVVAAVSFALGVYSLSYKKPGWIEVETAGLPADVAEEYTLFYKLGTTEKSATNEYKALAKAYSSALAEAYAAFDPSLEHEAGGNLATMSKHPNERVSVMPELYRALERINGGEGYKNELFMGPVYCVYWQLMTCRDDFSAAKYDPGKNSGLAGFCRKIYEYSVDPESIRVELSGDNKAVLSVSEEYLNFASESGITELVGLGWMRNAFIVDCVASKLESAGFTNGLLSSYDGFSRSLGVDDELNCNVFSKEAENVLSHTVLRYNGKSCRATAAISPFPVSGKDKKRFYVYSDGTVRDSYVFSGSFTGLSGFGCSEYGYLLSYKDGADCSELALALNRKLMAGLEENGLTLLEILKERLPLLEDAEFIYVSDSIYITDKNAEIYSGKDGRGLKIEMIG